ncbi:MAG: hypothetical protein JXX28_16025 [Deltaproteobacteria bacterium]|nr:hypothetical protein [Deltaproteobacteria bacterium]
MSYDDSLVQSLRLAAPADAVVHHAANLTEARQHMDSTGELALLVTERELTDGEGLALLSEARGETPQTSRVIVLRQECDPARLDLALRQAGPFLLIAPPVGSADVHRVVREGLALHGQHLRQQVATADMRQGVLDALQQVLALSSPEAYSRANAVSTLGMILHFVLTGRSSWEFRTAATLADLGLVALGPDLARATLAGGRSSPRQRALATQVPSLSSQILAPVPQMEAVRSIIFQAGSDYGGERQLEAQILLVASVVVGMQALNYPRDQILSYLRGKRERYSQQVVDALPAALDHLKSLLCQEVPLVNATPGMVLRDDLVALDRLLLPRGTTLSEDSLHRLRVWSRAHEVPLLLVVFARGYSPGDVCSMLCKKGGSLDNALAGDTGVSSYQR